MIRILTILAATAFAGIAQAESVTIPTAGKDGATLQHEIHKAAQQVCSRAYWDEPLAFYVVPGCVRRTVASAQTSLRDTAVASAALYGRDAAARQR